MKTLLALSALVAAQLLSLSAGAADVVGPTAAPNRDAFEWSAGAGAVGGGDCGGIVATGTVLARTDVFAYGGTLEAGGALATRLGLAGTAGLSFRDASGFGLDLLGVVGVHRYNGVGRGILTDDPGVGATLPFAGGRLRAVYAFGPGPRHFQLGLGVGVDRDLSRTTRNYTYQETPWLNLGGSSGPVTRNESRTIGFTTVGATIDFGMSFDAL